MILPEVYHKHLERYLKKSQLITVTLLVWLLQVQKTVKIERLAACVPLPIKYESRRRNLQRLLISDLLSVSLLWLPLIKEILLTQIPEKQNLIVALDRTQWKNRNLFMVSVIWKKRALPIYWQFLSKKGSSDLKEQIAVLRPVIKLLKNWRIIIVGDREFRSVELADWLKKQKIYFAIRVKEDIYIRRGRGQLKPLKSMGLSPGKKFFLKRIAITKEKGFGQFNLAGYWKRKYRGKSHKQAWYILTNLDSLESALAAFSQRSGIEAMFKDCKSGGYNLEGSQASTKRLTRLVMLIAIAYTMSVFNGQKVRKIGQQRYINRLKEIKRNQQRHSNFWVGLYGLVWTLAYEFCQDLVNQFKNLNPHKLSFYRQGERAFELIREVY